MIPWNRNFAGVAAATASSTLGGLSVVATRAIVARLDPATLGMCRFGIGAACLLAVAIVLRLRFPPRADLPRVALLGLLFFALFPWLFNRALLHTTAVHGAVALSSMPLLTLAVAAGLGQEALTARKAAGVLLATLGVAVALADQLFVPMPRDAWLGDLLMAAAALCGAIYAALSRPLLRRSAPLAYSATGMAAGALAMALLAFGAGSPSRALDLTGTQLGLVLFLGCGGAALCFYLWGLGLALTTPTRVAITVTANPVVSLVAGTLLLGEPWSAALLAGLAAVACGIALEASEPRRAVAAGVIR